MRPCILHHWVGVFFLSFFRFYSFLISSAIYIYIYFIRLPHSLNQSINLSKLKYDVEHRWWSGTETFAATDPLELAFYFFGYGMVWYELDLIRIANVICICICTYMFMYMYHPTKSKRYTPQS